MHEHENARSVDRRPPEEGDPRQGTSEAGQEAGTPGTGEPWFDQSWTKVHPLSPVVRGWVTIVAIPVAFFTYNWQMWTNLWEAFRTGELADNLQQNPLPYLIGGGAFLLLAAFIFVGFTLSWWFTRYKITDEHVMVKSGIFIRQHRQARIDRVQAVDLRQPLLARLTRLAELKFEVAEGDGTAATLAFLRKHEAEDLRTEIMDRAAGRSRLQGTAGESEVRQDQAVPYGAAPSSETIAQHPDYAPPGAERIPPEQARPDQIQAPPVDRELVRVPLGRLIGSVLVGIGSVVFVILVLVILASLGVASIVYSMVTGDPLREAMGGVNFPFLIPVIIGMVFSYYNQLSSGFRFTATMTTAGLRLKYGLLETTSQTVPPGRVQAVQIQQSLLWRLFGWYRMVVTVAGYGVTDRTTLLPVGTRDDVRRLAAEMFPDLQVQDPERVFSEGVSGTGVDGGYTQVPRRARLFDPLVWRRRGFFATPSALMIRDGRVTRLLTMVPHERIQSATLEQGPWARIKRVATLMIHLPAGPITARVKNQDLGQIRDLFEQESAYAAVARRLADRNQWMMPEELQEFERIVGESNAEEAASVGPGEQNRDQHAH